MSSIELAGCIGRRMARILNTTKITYLRPENRSPCMSLISQFMAINQYDYLLNDNNANIFLTL